VIVLIKFVHRLALAALLVMSVAFPVLAYDTEAAHEDSVVKTAVDPVENGVTEELQQDEPPLPGAGVETHTIVDASAGYRFFSVDGAGGRAAEYEYLHSSPVFSAGINSLGFDNKFTLDGSFLNEKDYYGDLYYDYKGKYRLHLRTESFYHNLQGEQLFTPDSFSFAGADFLARYLTIGDLYGVRDEQDQAEFRYKLNDYPLHLNLGYWRQIKEGTSQLVFADHSFEPVGVTNTVYAGARGIDRRTQEGSAGFDAHLGPVDVFYDFKIRQFDNLNDTPRGFFIARPLTIPEITPRLAGYQQHNEEPDSRFYSHTVKLHTSLTGGIVGAASYTFGKRENRSTLTDIVGANQTQATLQNLAGDLVYTPCKQFSAAIKYRLQQVDQDSPGAIASLFADTPGRILAVRPAINTERNVITATFSVRPMNLLSFKGEYRGEFTERDNLAFWSRPGVSASPMLPHNSSVNKGTFAILSRAIKGLRLKALYSYTAVNDPSYGTSFEKKQEGHLLATYSFLTRWGATASYRIAKGNNDQTYMTTLALFAPSVTYPLPRDQKTNNATMSLWVAPLDNLTVTASYSLLRNKTDQTVLFSSVEPGSNGGTNYTSQAQVFALNSTYRYNDKLDLSLALQQVRSSAEFDPVFFVLNPVSNTAQIELLSRLKTVESSVAARADYHFTKNFTGSINYTYRDYDDKYVSMYDGTVQTVSAQVTTKW